MSTERPTVSVCMATYNGAAHVGEQVRSILDQLGPDDELVAIDDASRDGTADVVETFGDPRVRLVRSPENRGYVATFGAALALARGEHLLLADQDDVWRPGRLEAMSAALRTSQVVASNLGTLGRGDALRGPFGQKDWRLRARDSRRHTANVLGILAGNRPYYGCAMGVRRDALAAVLPFPGYLVESHDLWLAMYGNLAGSITHLETRTLDRRLHENNQTPTRPRGVVAALRSRLLLLRAVVELVRRLRVERPSHATTR